MEHPLFKKIEHASTPDFGNVFSKSFDLFKKVWVEGTLHVLVTFAVSIPIFIFAYVPLVPVFIQANENQYGQEFNPFVEYPLPVIIGYFLLLMALIMISQVFTYAITAHFFKVLQKVDTGTSQDTGGYFAMIKGNFSKLFVLSLAATGIALLAALLCYLPLFYVMVPLQMLVVVFAFNPKLSVSEIIKASFKIGNKFWIIIFGLIFLSGIIAQLGVLLCFVGVFITASFVHIPLYYVYKDAVGFDDALPVSEI